MRKSFSYFFICGTLILISLALNSCKTTASVKSNGDKQSSAQKEKQKAELEYFFIEGCREKLAGRIENAEMHFRKCLKIDPKNAAVNYELANICRVTGRAEESIKYAKECMDAEPKNIWYNLAYIDGLRFKKQHILAAEAYDKLIKIYPNRSDLIESMAIEYAMGQNYAKAFKIYEELEKKFGTNETFTLNKIKLLKEQRKFQEAETELQKLINTNPSEPRYYYYLAEHYEDMRQSEKAMTTYKKILSIDPNNALVHLAMANYYKEHNNAEQAHNEFKIAFENPELDVDTKLKILLDYYSVSEEYPAYAAKGYELCAIMLKVHPSAPEAHSIYADFLWRDKKNIEARSHYYIAAMFDKNRYPIWNQLLSIDADIGQNDSLEKHSALAIELFPSQPLPYFFNGVANIQLKNYQKAIESFNDGLEFVQDNPRLMLNFYSNLGDVYNYSGQYEKSDKAYENALKIDPDNAYVLNNYSYYLSLRKEKLEKAERYSKRSNEISPNNPSYLDTYGWILFQQKKYTEAEIYLKMAIKLNNKRPDILEHYGDVLFRLGKNEEALQYWKMAQETGSKSEELQKKISAKKLND